jgi:hypothetical protein
MRQDGEMAIILQRGLTRPPIAPLGAWTAVRRACAADLTVRADLSVSSAGESK